MERSRQESKREAHNLKRSVSALEKRLASREQELSELNALHEREEGIQEELKREIVQLKQKVGFLLLVAYGSCKKLYL